ncbi:MAG: cytochrome c oxidase subunit II [Oricola sp.]
MAWLSGIVSTASAYSAGAAFAAQPTPWQVDLQPAGTGIMHEIRWFEEYTLYFLIPIVLLVLALLLYVIARYNKRANPNPSRTSHNTMIEIVWTIGPVLILLLFAVPSFQLLTAQYTPPSEPEFTIKATGNQWYWGYEYQGDETQDVSFDSYLLAEGDRAQAGKEDKAAYPRLLAVDNEIVVPTGATVRLLVTAGDVIHSWAMPAFGVKVDAVPGRLNETWFKVEEEGIYYGQCSELCGKDHAYMPIAVRAVSREQYDSWHAEALKDVAAANKMLMAAIETQRKLASAE